MSSPSDANGSSAGIGPRLRDARERAGLSLIQAAERLHVDPSAIEALESERFEEFGAAVYARGHIGHYAELVGESPIELQALYAASNHAVRPPDLTRGPHARATGPAPAPFVPAITVVIAVALIGFSWWAAGDFHGSVDEQRAAVPVGSDALSTAQNAETGTATATVAAVAVSGQVSAQAPAITARPRATVSPGPAGQVPPAAQVAHPGLSASNEATPAGSNPAVTPRSQGRAKVSALQLHFTEDSWAEVYDARGERLLFDVGSADSTRTVSGLAPLRVVLGNPTGVALALNGRPVSVPESAARNVSIEFQINRSGRVAPARLAAADARGEQKEPGRD